ncbi:MAG TPA: winged helix-turn-helix domain-containing protein, partial [Candidatus Limnocylindria bacterium]
MRTLSLQEARRLTILATQLAGPRPTTLLDVVERLTRVQVDPTSAVERAERLTLWSRLGAYDRDELRRL